MVGTVEDFVARQKATKGMSVDDPPIGEYELGCLGRYERVRIDLPVSEPALYARTAEALERLANAFRAASQARLPSPTDAIYKHERLMVILGLDRQVGSVRSYLTGLWKAAKRTRGAD